VNNPRVPPSHEQRQRALSELLGEFPPITSGLTASGHESGILYTESLAYLNGTFAAALVCAHASCERELAGWINWLGSDAPKGWDYWGLGKLTMYAVRGGGMPQAIADTLLDVSERRRLLSHYKSDAPPTSQWIRALNQLNFFDASDFQSAFTSVLAEDALLAIRACLLVRSVQLTRPDPGG